MALKSFHQVLHLAPCAHRRRAAFRHPTDEAKACRYASGIIKDHPFADGTKRTATAFMGTYLRLSGFEFKPSHADLLEAMLGTADGTWDFEPLGEWVQTAEG